MKREVLQLIRIFSLAISLIALAVTAYVGSQYLRLFNERSAIENNFEINRIQFSLANVPPSFSDGSSEEAATIKKFNLRGQQAVELVRKYYDDMTAKRESQLILGAIPLGVFLLTLIAATVAINKQPVANVQFAKTPRTEPVVAPPANFE